MYATRHISRSRNSGGTSFKASPKSLTAARHISRSRNPVGTSSSTAPKKRTAIRHSSLVRRASGTACSARPVCWTAARQSSSVRRASGRTLSRRPSAVIAALAISGVSWPACRLAKKSQFWLTRTLSARVSGSVWFGAQGVGVVLSASRTRNASCAEGPFTPPSVSTAPAAMIARISSGSALKALSASCSSFEFPGPGPWEKVVTA